MGEPYHLFARNCEQFVRYAHGLPQHGPQLDAARVGLGLLASFTLIAWAASGPAHG